jgi:hypothetical protein
MKDKDSRIPAFVAMLIQVSSTASTQSNTRSRVEQQKQSSLGPGLFKSDNNGYMIYYNINNLFVYDQKRGDCAAFFKQMRKECAYGYPSQAGPQLHTELPRL